MLRGGLEAMSAISCSTAIDSEADCEVSRWIVEGPVTTPKEASFGSLELSLLSCQIDIHLDSRLHLYKRQHSSRKKTFESARSYPTLEPPNVSSSSTSFSRQ